MSLPDVDVTISYKDGALSERVEMEAADLEACVLASIAEEAAWATWLTISSGEGVAVVAVVVTVEVSISSDGMDGVEAMTAAFFDAALYP